MQIKDAQDTKLKGDRNLHKKWERQMATASWKGKNNHSRRRDAEKSAHLLLDNGKGGREGGDTLVAELVHPPCPACKLCVWIHNTSVVQETLREISLRRCRVVVPPMTGQSMQTCPEELNFPPGNSCF